MQFSRVAWESSTVIFVNFAHVFFQQCLIVFTQKYFNDIFFLKFVIAMQLCLCLLLLLFFFYSCLIWKKIPWETSWRNSDEIRFVFASFWRFRNRFKSVEVNRDQILTNSNLVHELFHQSLRVPWTFTQRKYISRYNFNDSIYVQSCSFHMILTMFILKFTDIVTLNFWPKTSSIQAL